MKDTIKTASLILFGVGLYFLIKYIYYNTVGAPKSTMEGIVYALVVWPSVFAIVAGLQFLIFLWKKNH